ncbi:hormogonium polysaccharide secretion pseudopilin HpsB [Nostoc sp. PA-18-2419]|uniref:hormogonium polysaccharide secretion pseudopilin HpsB n=1 Tax=Nostoc sp. PA-18-2419 TaxID=2575443 RepID=UPI00110998BF|nr:hormogonium polysaccharide secretion pseudopilin HpsB [Nostoc sp. PA-18-2419]
MKPHQLQESSAQFNESGFTIIESLVAIIVVSILLVAIAPVLVISTATRVQARRVELATEAAKALVNGINSKIVSDPTITVTLTADPTRKVSTSTSDYLLSSALVPTTATKNTLYCFNKNGSLTNPSCTSDLFYIQAIRLAVSGSDPDKGQGYRLGIRVYRSDAEFDSLTAANSGKKAATFTGGLGDRKAPLLEMTTEIVRGQSSYSALCSRLGGCQ